MKRILFTMLILLSALNVSAKTDVDFSSRFQEGTNTIYASSAWGWHAVYLTEYEVAEAEYLYIQYESSCDFELILQNQDWQNAYQKTGKAGETEVFLKLVPNAIPKYSCVVIQNHSEGEITINKAYFCSEQEFLNPAPEDVEGARENLRDIYLRYQRYEGTFTLGTGYGCYPTELYDAFAAALQGALVLDTAEGENLTAEQLNALSQAIVDAYMALVAGEIKYLPADGYYRIVCARKFVNGDEEYGYFDKVKALYSKNNGENWWDDRKEDDPAYIWTLARQEDDTYQLMNANNHLIFSSPAQCSDSEKTISIDPVSKSESGYDLGYDLSTDDPDVVIFNFRMSNEPAHDYKYVHMNWHSSGTGWSGPLTTWCNYANDPCGASEYYLEPIDKEVAESILNSNYNHAYGVMLADAKQKASIANDMIKTALITEGSQMTSPVSQNDFGSADGGNLGDGVLIDGNVNTYWHSVWSTGNAETGSHYIQVEFAEPVEGNLEFEFSRRMTSSNHLTKWGIYGSNEPSGEKYDYEWIVDLDAPYSTQGETLRFPLTIDEGKSYQYLRFYCESQGFFHLSEMQVYALAENPTNQASLMGEVYANLEKALKAAESVNLEAVSKADYDALKAAYDPFIALFVDPTPLRDALKVADPALDIVEIGTNPGQWSESAIADIMTAIAEAKAYDKAGKYTQEQTDAYMQVLENPMAKVQAAANKVETNKYYAIRFASEDKYEEMGWSTSNVVSETAGDLFDNYLCSIAAEEDPEAEEAQEPGINLIFSDNADADIEFCFVPAGDNLYTIKHKATGRYIHVNGYDSWTNLTSQAVTFFTVEAIGHGENIIHATDSEGNDLSYLHAQLSDHRLVTWHDHYAGSNSGLIIEELGEISEEDAIANVEQASAKAANIYNMAGQLVRKAAKQNDVKGLSKGLYIQNGTKIIVK